MRKAALAVMMLLGATACMKTPGSKVEADVKKVQSEREPDKLVERGKGFARLGDLTRAEQYLSAALEAGAEPKTVLPMLLRVCVEGGRLRVAIKHASDYLANHPGDVKLRYLLGTLHKAVGEPEEARKQFDRVLEEDPSNAEAHYALAVIDRDTNNDLVRADYHFREYLRLRPAGPHAQEAQGSLLKGVP